MVSNGNVTGIIDRLVAEGMVVRLAHEATGAPPSCASRPRAPSSSRPWPRRTRPGSARSSPGSAARTPKRSSACWARSEPQHAAGSKSHDVARTDHLSSSRVRLELLDHRHASDLIEAVEDGELWRLWYTTVPAPEKMGAEIDRRLGLHAAGSMLPFAVIDTRRRARPSA